MLSVTDLRRTWPYRSDLQLGERNRTWCRRNETLSASSPNCPISHSVDEVERILVVDDEPGIVDVLTFALEEAGFATLVANDGLTALRMALTESPALILLDVMCSIG